MLPDRINAYNNEYHEENRSRDLPLILTILIPLVAIIPVLPPDFGFRYLVVLFLTVFFCVGVYCMRHDRRRFLTACILALISVELFWVSLWSAASSLFIYGELFLLLFLIYQIHHLIPDFIDADGDIWQVFSYCIALVLLGGMACGTGLHLADLVSRPGYYEISSLHNSYGQAVTVGILIILHGGGVNPTSALSGLILIIGSLCGFLLLIVSIGKIVMVFKKTWPKMGELR